MRDITWHKVNGCNDGLEIIVQDEPSHGGACHKYYIGWSDNHYAVPQKSAIAICFQKGPIKEAGVNGITHEVLLAILIDRLQGFQSGEYACADNQVALESCRQALIALQRRTLARVARGVEGTHEK